MTESARVETRINFGCGQYPKPGFCNVDLDPATPADVHWNLDETPFPFADSCAERIEADHVLEHLHHPFAFMAECWRILQPGGDLVIRVPHASRAMTHPDHKRGFDVTFPLYFQPTFPGGYVGPAFEHGHTTLRWAAQLGLRRQMAPGCLVAAYGLAGAVISFVANLSPMAASRIWCYWVGGFDEIEYQLRKPRPAEADQPG